MPEHDELLTVDEAACLLRVPRSWVYARARLNRLPCVRLGKYVRFDREALLKWLHAQADRREGSE